jgi:hypothetical protein
VASSLIYFGCLFSPVVHQISLVCLEFLNEKAASWVALAVCENPESLLFLKPLLFERPGALIAAVLELDVTVFVCLPVEALVSGKLFAPSGDTFLSLCRRQL